MNKTPEGTEELKLLICCILSFTVKLLPMKLKCITCKVNQDRGQLCPLSQWKALHANHLYMRCYSIESSLHPHE